MNEAILIYLYLTAGHLLKFLTVFGWFSAVVLVVTTIAFYSCSIDGYKIKYRPDEAAWHKNMFKKVLPYTKALVITALISTFLFIALPSKKDLVYIVGGATVINVAKDNSEESQKLPKNILNVVNGFLEEINSKEEDKKEGK